MTTVQIQDGRGSLTENYKHFRGWELTICTSDDRLVKKGGVFDGIMKKGVSR